jgi:hypothetical protein
MGYKIKSSSKHYIMALPHHALETMLTKYCIISTFKEQSVLSVTFFDVGPICIRFLITKNKQKMVFLISNFHRVLNVVCILLGNSLVSKFYMPIFWNTVSVPSS